MARPRKPLNLLKATGAYRPDRHADRGNAPQADGQPEMPQWLDEEARSCWQTTVPQLVAMGVASNVDSLALAGMCRWYSVWRKADARLQQGKGDSYKLTIEAATGWKNYSAVAAKFGLTPGDREKLSVPEPGDAASDEFSKLLV